MVVIWGVNFIVLKAALAEITPLALNALRFGTAAACEAIRGFASGSRKSLDLVGLDLCWGASLEMAAERVAGGWKLNGAKLYITNAPFADFLLVAARTRLSFNMPAELMLKPDAVSVPALPVAQRAQWRERPYLRFDPLLLPDLRAEERERFRRTALHWLTECAARKECAHQ